MILATRYAGDVQLRSSWPDRTQPMGRYAAWSSSGEQVTNDRAFGVPALGRAIRLVAGVGASLCLEVYEGEYADKRTSEAYPADLFDRPVEGVSAYDWLYDIFVALEAAENAVLLKRRSRGKVVELPIIPPDMVRIHLSPSGEKRFDVLEPSSGRVTTLTSADVLHIRGHTPFGGPVGVSRIWQHRDPMGAMLAAQKFEGAFFRNHARPDIAIIYPQGVTQEQGREWTDVWNAQFAGPDNAGKAVPMGGGADLRTIPVSLADAQFLEQKRYGVEEVGRIMDVHPVLLGDLASLKPGIEQEALDHFLSLQMRPRLRRVEAAFAADADLFPARSKAYPQFRVSDLMFANAAQVAAVQHSQIQDGTLLVDEARAELGRPPLPDGLGMVPQITPVGGAPNPSTTAPIQEP